MIDSSVVPGVFIRAFIEPQSVIVARGFTAGAIAYFCVMDREAPTSIGIDLHVRYLGAEGTIFRRVCQDGLFKARLPPSEHAVMHLCRQRKPCDVPYPIGDRRRLHSTSASVVPPGEINLSCWIRPRIFPAFLQLFRILCGPFKRHQPADPLLKVPRSRPDVRGARRNSLSKLAPRRLLSGGNPPS